MTDGRPATRSTRGALAATILVGLAAYGIARVAVPKVITVLREARKPAFEKALTRAIGAHGGAEEFRLWAMGQSSGDEAYVEGMLLARRGLIRLSPADQLLRLRVLTRRMSVASVSECGPIARGTVTKAQGAAYFAAMNPADIDSFAGLVARALLAEIRRSPPAVGASSDDQGAFLNHLAEVLTPAEAQRFDSVAAAGPTASDADACWVNRVIYDAAIAADQPDRERWVRVVTSLESSSVPPAARPN